MGQYTPRCSPRAVKSRRKKALTVWRVFYKESMLFPLNQVIELNPNTGLTKSGFYKRMKKYKQQQIANPNTEIIPSFLQKNQSKQIFTPDEELVLAIVIILEL